MAALAPMPSILVNRAQLIAFGEAWQKNRGSLSRQAPFSGGLLGRVFEQAVSESLSVMLGGVPIVAANSTALTPPQPNCVEIGNIRIISAVRPQNFDVVYRPDGVRFALDGKTLNDAKSVAKNWQNMVNDLATEATTVHGRYPHALVTFIVVIPAPCLTGARQKAIIETLERLARRTDVSDPVYMAEAIALVVWNPIDGTISSDVPEAVSPLRIERFSEQVEATYTMRYKGLPPHSKE